MQSTGARTDGRLRRLLVGLCYLSSFVFFYGWITHTALSHHNFVQLTKQQDHVLPSNITAGANGTEGQPSSKALPIVFGDPYFNHRFSSSKEVIDIYEPSASALPDSTLFPRVDPWNIDFQSYVNRGTALLAGVNDHCLWPTPYWDYEQLTEDGYDVKRARDYFHDSWKNLLESIGLYPYSEVINWSCSRTTGRLDRNGEAELDGGIVVQFQLEAGIMVMLYTYKPEEAPPDIIVNLSDIVYLGWQEMASVFAPDTYPLPKYFLVEGVANIETMQIVRTCIGTSNTVIPPWPGRLWSINEPCGKALLGSPSGRAIGYLIAQHLEVLPDTAGAEEAIPMKGVGIAAVRVFDLDDSQLNLIFYLSSPPQPAAPSRPQPRDVSNVQHNNIQALAGSSQKNVHRLQARLFYDYSKWVRRGELVLEAVRSQCANQSPWRDFASLQEGGYAESFHISSADEDIWEHFFEEIGRDPDELFSEIWVRREFRLHKDDALTTDGRYKFMLDIEEGILISSTTYRARSPAPNTIVNLSDIMFLAWKRECERNDVPRADIKYYMVEDIVNKDTQYTIESACGGDTGLWPGVDAAIDSECGKAVLGSPSGIAIGYMLAQHLEDFPDKQIGYVKIFDNNVGWPTLVFYLGPSDNIPRPPAGPHSIFERRNHVSTPPQAFSTEEIIKRETLFEASRDRGRRLIAAIDAQDTCPLTPTKFPTFDALADGGYEVDKREMFVEPPWNRFLSAIRADPSTRLVRWRCQRSVDVHDTPFPMQVFDGIFVQDLLVNLGIMMMVRTYQAREPAPGTIEHLSDIMFLGWKRVCEERGVQNPTIKYFLVDSVVNTYTERIVFQALDERKRKLSQFPGVTFSADDADGGVAFYAILGTPSGRGIAWMIINHAEDLPRKTVRKVTVFDGTDGRNRLCMIFHVSSMAPGSASFTKRLEINPNDSHRLNDASDLGFAAPAA